MEVIQPTYNISLIEIVTMKPLLYNEYNLKNFFMLKNKYNIILQQKEPGTHEELIGRMQDKFVATCSI
jgi:hypothetical protein